VFRCVHCSYYLHAFGLDSATTAIYTAFFSLIILRILHKNMVDDAFNHNDRDCLIDILIFSLAHSQVLLMSSLSSTIFSVVNFSFSALNLCIPTFSVYQCMISLILSPSGEGEGRMGF
jgi:hypothetical protein